MQSELFFDFAVERKIAVAGVAEERVTDACEMGADLVHAARFELDFYQVVAFVMLLDSVVGDCLLGILAGFSDFHFATLGGVGASERFVYGSLVFFEVAFDERVIEFVDFVFANHASKVAERVAVEGGDNHARGFLVETVGYCGLKVEPFAAAPFPQVFYEAFAGASAGTRLACESRGLVHDHVVFGLNDDVEFLGTPRSVSFVSRLSSLVCFAPGGLSFRETGAGFLLFVLARRELDNVGCALGIRVDALKVFINTDGIAFLQHLVRFAHDSVHADFLFADDGEKYRQRFVGECLAQKTVEAHVGKVAVNDSGNHKLSFFA